MTNERDVWVLIEQEEGQIAEISLELLAKGHELAQTLGSRVCAVLCGYQLDGLAEKVIEQGADHVFVADHPELEMYRTLTYTRVTVDLVRQHTPYIFLVGASPVGRD